MSFFKGIFSIKCKFAIVLSKKYEIFLDIWRI